MVNTPITQLMRHFASCALFFLLSGLKRSPDPDSENQRVENHHHYHSHNVDGQAEPGQNRKILHALKKRKEKLRLLAAACGFKSFSRQSSGTDVKRLKSK